MALITWSDQPSERDVQRYGLAFLGWLLVSVLVIAIPALIEASRTTGDDHSLGWVPLRTGLGIVAMAIAAWLLTLVRRHRDAIAAAGKSRGQWRTMAILTALASIPAQLFWWWPAFGASALGVVALVAVTRMNSSSD